MPSRIPWRRPALAAASFGVYLTIFPLLYSAFGRPSLAAAAVPVVVSALLLGARGGVAAGLLQLPVNWAAQMIVGAPTGMPFFQVHHIVTSGSAVIIGGVVGGYADMRRDLARAHVELRDRRDTFDLIARASQDILWNLDVARGDVWVNAEFGLLTTGSGHGGRRPLSSMWAYVHPDDHLPLQNQLDSLVSGVAEESEQPFRLRDQHGAWRTCEARAYTVKDGSGAVSRIVGAMRDVTARIEAEEARLEAARQAAELSKAREMDAFKTQLLSTASHELNTPISVIKLQLASLVRARVRGDGPALESGMGVLDRNITRLGDLVRDTLDVARIQSGRMEIHYGDLDLGGLLADIQDTYRPLAEANGVAIRFDATDARLRADGRRLAQVLHNLVSNALKFTPEGGDVEVVAQQEGPEVRIGVRDSGLGLTQEQIGMLFQPFVRPHHDPDNTYKGTGLGLFISKGIVEGHGGRIECESAGPGQGATFWLTLPRRPSRPRPAPRGAPHRQTVSEESATPLAPLPIASTGQNPRTQSSG